jgi:hypothetical protein
VWIGEVWWSEQNEEDTMRVGVAVVLALAIAALVTWYSERPTQPKPSEKCDHKEATPRFPPCWIADT